MKKAIILAALLGSFGAAQAQELRSKKGEFILPEAGDYSIGISANPFLEYFGNFFGKTNANVAPNWNYITNNQTITGKYFVTPSLAYRGTVRLGFGANTTKAEVVDRSLTTMPVYPALPSTKENIMKEGHTNVGLSFGIEKRKGFTRLQGFYGAEVGINMNNTKTSFDYGNNLTTGVNGIDVDADDAFVGFNNGANVTSDVYGNAARLTYTKNSAFTVGVRGFVGAEYFVLPKISVGGEFGWGIGFTASTTNKHEMESIGNNGANDIIGTIEMPGEKSSSFKVDTDNANSVLGPNAQLKINLHF